MENIFTRTNLLAKAYGSGGYSGSSGVGAFVFWMFSSFAMYAYSGLSLMFIAKKTKTTGGWMAWVPFLNLYLTCKLAGKSGIWIILLLIPFVNIVAIVLIWSAIAERLNRPAWWGILMLVPIANLVIMGILAFSGTKGVGPIIKKAVSAVSFVSNTPKGGANCSKCGASADESDKFCPECGGKVIKKTPPKSETKEFCSECGAKTGSGKFCPECGAKS